MNSRDQDRQLVRLNLVAADICSNDVGREFSIDRRRRCFVGHFGSPCRDRQDTIPGEIEAATLGSPLGITVAPLTSFWFLGPNSPRLSSVEPTWEVESEIHSDEFSICTWGG
jgi:hypothetical protein